MGDRSSAAAARCLCDVIDPQEHNDFVWLEFREGHGAKRGTAVQSIVAHDGVLEPRFLARFCSSQSAERGMMPKEGDLDSAACGFSAPACAPVAADPPLPASIRALDRCSCRLARSSAAFLHPTPWT